MAADQPNQYPQLPADPPPASWLAQNRRLAILGGGVVGVAVIALVVWQIGTGPTGSPTNTGNSAETNTSTVNSRPASVFRRYTLTLQPDQDRDGLTDAEEESLGTNPAQADTDGDGLSDYDESKVYRTDPRKPDSDGDGASDGQEVRQATNPLGPGTLLNINQALQHLTNN